MRDRGVFPDPSSLNKSQFFPRGKNWGEVKGFPYGNPFGRPRGSLSPDNPLNTIEVRTAPVGQGGPRVYLENSPRAHIYMAFYPYVRIIR